MLIINFLLHNSGISRGDDYETGRHCIAGGSGVWMQLQREGEVIVVVCFKGLVGCCFCSVFGCQSADKTSTVGSEIQC